MMELLILVAILAAGAVLVSILTTAALLLALLAVVLTGSVLILPFWLLLRRWPRSRARAG